MRKKKLFFNLRRLKGQMQAIDDGDLRPEQVTKMAQMLDVPEPEIISMNRRLVAPDSSLNAPMRADGESEWQDWLMDESDTQENVLATREELSGRKALLPDALKDLTDRERHILTARRLKDTPATLGELAEQYGISRERVRQIEVRAFEKLQKGMKTLTRNKAWVSRTIVIELSKMFKQRPVTGRVMEEKMTTCSFNQSRSAILISRRSLLMPPSPATAAPGRC